MVDYVERTGGAIGPGPPSTPQCAFGRQRMIAEPHMNNNDTDAPF
jgi:hypothetical protein